MMSGFEPYIFFRIEPVDSLKIPAILYIQKSHICYTKTINCLSLCN